MARQKDSVDDKYWLEVRAINSYAVFMGYLLMGVRGLGLLVLTWTTVVLLGGFVSMLQKKDFWCLTVITLVQIARVFDFLLKEKASDVLSTWGGSVLPVTLAMVTRTKKDTNTSVNSSKKFYKRRVVATILRVFQTLMHAIVTCSLAILYVLGLYLTAGISLWRLIQQDYANNSDGGANLKPALNVLYSLAVAQGVLYGYRNIYDSVARTALVEHVATDYSLETDLISEYLDETVTGCMKDLSFARGRNLVTYAVDLLMESKSRYGYISGVLILGKIMYLEQIGLFKQLLAGSASFSHVVHRLAKTFGPRSPYSTEIRMRAATIMATVADNIRLDQFPAQGMMMCVSSLLDTFEDYSWRPEGYDERRRWYNPCEMEYERAWQLDEAELCHVSIDEIPRPKAADSKAQGYKGLVVQGLFILQGLAVDEDNCRVICNTQGLLSKAMAHLMSNRLHSDDHHDEWSSMAQESLELMKRLMAMATLSPSEETEATKLPREISGNIQAIISTLKGILECVRCPVQLKRQAVQILLDLYVDTHTPASVLPRGLSSSTTFLWILLDVFLLPDYHFDRMCGSTHLEKKSSDIARLAGDKMQAMLPSSSKKKSMLPSVVGDVIGSLARTVAGSENNAYRIHAATILMHICENYSKEDENLKELKKAITSVMPEVLKEIVHWLVTKEVLQAVPEANNGGNALLAMEGPDFEQGGVPHDNIGQEESSSNPHQPKIEQHQGIQLLEALVDLCSKTYWRWVVLPDDQDLTRHFYEMAAKICSEQGMPNKTFGQLVCEAQDKLEEKKASRLVVVRIS